MEGISQYILDIIVIGVVLIAALIGLKKGFVKVLFDLIKRFASFFIAVFLVKPVRAFFRTTVVNDKIYEFFLNWTSGKGSPYTDPIPAGGMNGDYLHETLNIPKFLADFLSKVIGDGSSSEGMTLGQVLSETLTYYVLTIIAFILLLIVASIVIALLCKLFTSIFESEYLKPINRLLGFILGIAIGVVTIWIAFIVVDFVGTLLPVVQEKMTLWFDESKIGFARILYDNNFMATLLQGKMFEYDVLAREEEPATEAVIMWKNLLVK